MFKNLILFLGYQTLSLRLSVSCKTPSMQIFALSPRNITSRVRRLQKINESDGLPFFEEDDKHYILEILKRIYNCFWSRGSGLRYSPFILIGTFVQTACLSKFAGHFFYALSVVFGRYRRGEEVHALP